jgi:hypothetical protein
MGAEEDSSMPTVNIIASVNFFNILYIYPPYYLLETCISFYCPISCQKGQPLGCLKPQKQICKNPFFLWLPIIEFLPQKALLSRF